MTLLGLKALYNEIHEQQRQVNLSLLFQIKKIEVYILPTFARYRTNVPKLLIFCNEAFKVHV